MKFTREHHEVACKRLRQLKLGAEPSTHDRGICYDISREFRRAGVCGKTVDFYAGYNYCERIFRRMGLDGSWPIGHTEGPKWFGTLGADRRAFAGFMADIIEHTYLQGDAA